MPKVNRHKRPVPSVSTRTATFELNDYSAGMNTYLGNDKFPMHSGGINMWRLAQDARITTAGEYETRKGFDFYSIAAGELTDSSLTSGTSLDKTFNEQTWQAMPVTIVGPKYVNRVDIFLQNPGTGNSAATGTIRVEIWSDSGGSPGTRLGRTTIAASAVTTTYAYCTARFAEPLTLASGTYWIVANVQPSGSNSYNWQTGGATTLAKVTTDAGSSWSATTYSFKYKIFTCALDLGGSKGLHKAYKSDGTSVTLLATGISVYKVDDTTGALTSIVSTLSTSATRYRFVTVNDIVYYCNGYDGLRKYDLSTATESQVNTTNYTDLIVHKGLLFGVRSDDPTRIDWSNFGLYETFTNTDFQEVPAPKTGDGIAALASLNGYLLIRTKNRCFIISGSGSSDFALDTAPDQKGTYTPETQVADKSSVYFLSDDGIYRSNGTQAELISSSIYNDIIKLANKSSACMALQRGRLYLWYTAAGAAYNNKCYVINLNGPGGKEIVESVDTNAFVARAANTLRDDDLIVANSVVGQVLYQERSSNDYSNLGSELNFELRTHYLTGSSPAVLKAIRYWEPRFGAQDDNYVMTCEYAVDLRDSFQTIDNIDVQGVGSIWGASAMVWGAFTWGATKETQAQLYVPGEYRRISLRFTHTAARQPQKYLGQTVRFQERRMR